MITQKLLTADEVRTMFFAKADGTPSVSVRWVLANIRRVQLSPKVVRFRADDVELWLASRVREAA